MTDTGKLSLSQKHMLAKVGEDWKPIPCASCTNSTLNALERRGLIETRIEPGTPIGRFFAPWEARRVQPAAS